MMMLVHSSKAAVVTPPTTYTKTFTQSGSFIIPAGVSVLSEVRGKGGAGQAGYYQPQNSRTATIDQIIFIGGGTGGAFNGAYTWDDLAQDAYTAANKINQGGSGTVYGVGYVGYGGDTTYNVTLRSANYNNAVPGSASAVFPAGYGSGPITSDTSTFNYVQWSEYGAYVPGSNGASSTGFGQVFAGGVGGPASESAVTNVSVTSGATYQVNIPAGGYITITYKA